MSKSSRAVAYERNGEPGDVLQGVTYSLPDRQPHEARVRLRLAPINPADVNVIQGAYPSKPRSRDGLFGDKPGFIVGNEGLAEVVEAPADGSLQVGQLAVMAKAQLGTWQSHANIDIAGLLPLPMDCKASDVQLACLAVNPATAYQMLKSFVQLQPGEWFIQNGATSAAGEAAIQLGREWGLKSINIIRDKSPEELERIKRRLHDLGANHVVTVSELADGKTLKAKIAEWTDGKPPRLGLNCVSGPTTTDMARQLGSNATLVTYGAMSKGPLSLPSSLFIFKGLTSTGFWLSQWYASQSADARAKMAAELVKLYESGALVEPTHEVIAVGGREQSDDELGRIAREAVSRSGSAGKKLLFRFA